ncbi:DNA-binding NarL/FixJ family response regulator [Nonomuraea polychroma]|uniref:DNA-binding NarL/FixJ family response regulator n=1 Tax=Nonomuraea polychroma TaxID=46176 RepID=A0A438M7Y1_9ACTN|nr:response regulator transcription factor [Nonomuraea polychroma]RVX41184.1 LuxR family two component transcriptional regulator [Nonomuraea polychroma]RVX41834.1 DNA-binding NarL/FixJ family response regulator [Nonomuraea polychroma]
MRIVIAEDAVMLREGLCMLLTSRDHEVVAAVGDGDALLAAVAEHGPDIAVVDVRMPPTHTDEGLRAAIQIRRDHPEVGVLVFSQYIETRYATQLLAGGAHGVGYLLKERVADVKDFLAALDQIAVGQTVLDPEVVTQIMGASRRAETLGTLTPREREVLAMMAEGRSNNSIAAALFLSYGSVEKHVTQIFTKLGLSPSDNDHRRVLAVLHYLQA